MNKNLLNLLLLSTASISSMNHSKKSLHYRSSELANTSNTANPSSSNSNTTNDPNMNNDPTYPYINSSTTTVNPYTNNNNNNNNNNSYPMNNPSNNNASTNNTTSIPNMEGSATFNPHTFSPIESASSTTTSNSFIPMGPIFNEKVDALLPNNLEPRFVLPPLPYAYDALEPYIDEATLRIHHNRHHQTYINNLNTAISRYPDIYAYNLGQMLTYTDRFPIDIQSAITQNGGGHYNHTFYWNIMSPDGGDTPTGAIGDEINRQFGSFSNFKRAFTAAALSVFGSGYAWLVLTLGGRLEIITTRNQDTPLSLNALPLLAIDVWEHAYYLKHQNERARYIEDFFNVINWPYVNSIFEAAMESRYAK